MVKPSDVMVETCPWRYSVLMKLDVSYSLSKWRTCICATWCVLVYNMTDASWLTRNACGWLHIRGRQMDRITDDMISSHMLMSFNLSVLLRSIHQQCSLELRETKREKELKNLGAYYNIVSPRKLVFTNCTYRTCRQTNSTYLLQPLGQTWRSWGRAARWHALGRKHSPFLTE